MYPLNDKADLDPLLNDIAGKEIVMLGEASHGTHEFYTWRTIITKRLIEEKGFRFIAVEGDWPDCYLINRYVKGYKDAGPDILAVLKRFDRWPRWMWANYEIAALAEWLKDYNSKLSPEKKIGFYGLDVYSLWDSLKTMIQYLDKEDKTAADTVRKAIGCFEPFEENEQLYARQSLRNHNCADAVVNMLREIRLRAQFLDGDREAGFNTEQNAWIAVNAEKYYRSMIGFDNESWNIRDTHMIETLDRLLKFHGPASKAIVWEHNTHVGDARATDMKKTGMINIGQLARQNYGEENVYLLGFASFSGTVVAGEEWGAPTEIMDLPEAREGSIEAVLHNESTHDRYYLLKEPQNNFFNTSVRHRAVGVVYRPAYDRISNYVPSVLKKRYDCFVYLDNTTALHPVFGHSDMEKVPETYPFGE
jgi:erythromycin esterase